MPTVTAQGKTFHCKTGANLRQVLMENGIDLYSPKANYVNCMGIGTCGTCAAEIEAAEDANNAGAISQVNWRDTVRRSLPPHNPSKPLRLACQTQVLRDIKITKYKGFWGHQLAVAWTPEGKASLSD
ncbi:MAG: (2Fe-2S)-binding protein [Leptolyngbya foveolarum]|uniref:(2Fe-2S)-binding protein n=1 Tax=Leptolyngbya foveolarum TaxID=47253 RepID=A0A2W4WPP7_9CYAN|nr:MAG: (2Fe-2S)-binding protein [Leptolyngbya foveolarum]